MVEMLARTAAMPVVTCAGSPRQRGEAHGEALREVIAAGLARWRDSIGAAHGIDPDIYIVGFMEETDFLPAIRRWTPGLLEEVEGIARGSGQPWQWIYASNLLDEEWTFARAFRRGTGPGCTACGFAAAGEAPVLAQTMDIPSVHDGTQALLRIEAEDGPPALVFTRAGMIGLTGCNAAGLAVVVNNLETLPTSDVGLPVAFALRGVLARRTLDEAAALLREMLHATGQHYGLAGPDGFISVEGWAGGTAEAPMVSTLMHTNHPLLTEATEGDVETPYRRTRTRERLAYLEREAGERRDVAGVQELLADRTTPISLGADRPGMTFGAVVYACETPARMWVAPGPPHETPFVEVSA